MSSGKAISCYLLRERKVLDRLHPMAFLLHFAHARDQGGGTARCSGVGNVVVEGGPADDVGILGGTFAEEVLTIQAISPSWILSRMCGRPWEILLICSQLIPASVRWRRCRRWRKW